jgi:hypothetical protein
MLSKRSLAPHKIQELPTSTCRHDVPLVYQERHRQIRCLNHEIFQLVPLASWTPSSDCEHAFNLVRQVNSSTQHSVLFPVCNPSGPFSSPRLYGCVSRSDRVSYGRVDFALSYGTIYFSVNTISFCYPTSSTRLLSSLSASRSRLARQTLQTLCTVTAARSHVFRASSSLHARSCRHSAHIRRSASSKIVRASDSALSRPCTSIKLRLVFRGFLMSQANIAPFAKLIIAGIPPTSAGMPPPRLSGRPIPPAAVPGPVSSCDSC